MLMGIASIIISDAAFSQNGNIQLTSPRNAIGILSVPTLQNFSVSFELANVDHDTDHKIELILKDLVLEKERRIFENTLAATKDKLEPEDIAVVNGVINLNRVQIDSFGLHDIIFLVDGIELANAKVIFSQIAPQD